MESQLLHLIAHFPLSLSDAATCKVQRGGGKRKNFFTHFRQLEKSLISPHRRRRSLIGHAAAAADDDVAPFFLFSGAKEEDERGNFSHLSGC
jgi:hypothetical protein